MLARGWRRAKLCVSLSRDGSTPQSFALRQPASPAFSDRFVEIICVNPFHRIKRDRRYSNVMVDH